jgi:CRP-like cAMP-binding protein
MNGEPKALGAELGAEERARLIARFGRTFLAGDALFREGEPAREAFLLQEGRVRLVRRVRAVDRSFNVLRQGDLFGESALVDETPRQSTALALTEGVALAVDRQTFGSLLQHHPFVATRILEQLIRRVRDAEDQIEILLLEGTQSKIVNALLKLARVTGHGGVELAVSPVELSARVGLDVETVKRAVQRLRDQQYVRIVAEKVEIPDVEALRRLYTLLGTKDELRGLPEKP